MDLNHSQGSGAASAANAEYSILGQRATVGIWGTISTIAIFSLTASIYTALIVLALYTLVSLLIFCLRPQCACLSQGEECIRLLVLTAHPLLTKQKLTNLSRSIALSYFSNTHQENRSPLSIHTLQTQKTDPYRNPYRSIPLVSTLQKTS